MQTIFKTIKDVVISNTKQFIFVYFCLDTSSLSMCYYKKRTKLSDWSPETKQFGIKITFKTYLICYASKKRLFTGQQSVKKGSAFRANEGITRILTQKKCWSSEKKFWTGYNDKYSLF